MNPGSRSDRCRGQIATASSLLPKLRDERRRALADPEYAHQKLYEMVNRGAIDLADVIDLLRDGEPDEAGRVPGEGELLVRKVIDPRITIYKHSLLDGLRTLKARNGVLVKGIASPEAWAAGWLVRNPRARESRSRPVRSRGSRRLSRAGPSSDDDGLADLHRCPRCGGADWSFASGRWWCDRCEYEGWRQEVEEQLARVLLEADRITREAS